jgi:drug/metabolite transporter (DMT)-like permease
VRYCGAAIWLALFIASTRNGWPSGRNWRRHVLGGVLTVATACFFYAIAHLPLAIATALAMSAPIHVSLVGILFLREGPSAILALPAPGSAPGRPAPPATVAGVQRCR